MYFIKPYISMPKLSVSTLEMYVSTISLFISISKLLALYVFFNKNS